MQHEYEPTHAEDEWLASLCLLEQRDKMVVDLQKELEQLRIKWDNMQEWNRRVLTAKAELVSQLSAMKLPIEANDKVKSKLPRSRSSADRKSDAA